jgi:hypothetical protein
MTFDECCARWNATPAERVELAWHLAALRMRRLIEALLPGHLQSLRSLPEGQIAPENGQPMASETGGG